MRWLGAVLLSLTVVVVGPAQPAAALDWKDLTKVEKLDLYGPKVKQGTGVVKFVLGATPPGRAWKILGAAALAYGAYQGADYLLNARQPGGSVTDWLGAPAAAYPTSMDDGVITANIVSVNPAGGGSISMEIGCHAWGPPSPTTGITTCVGHAISGGNVAVSAGNTAAAPVRQVECRNNTTLAVRTTNLVMTTSWFRSSSRHSSADATSTVNQAVSNSDPTKGCTTSETLLGFRLGPAGGTNPNGGTRYQTAAIGWGTLSAAPTTYPPGDLTFRHAVVQAKCKNASTGAVQTITTVSEWGASETLAIPSCKQRLGDDWYGIGVKVIPMDPAIDDVPLDPEVWPDWDVPDFMPEEWDQEVIPEEEAEPCQTDKDGCPTVIEIDGEPVFPGSTTRTKIETIRKLDPNRVKCYLGQREVEWRLCVPLLPSFEPGAGTGTAIDPTKPETGTDVPTTGTGTQPVPTDLAGCLKAGFSFNPVSWVVEPLKCLWIPKTWPDVGTMTSPIPPGWLPTLPALSGGTCGVVNMPSLNLGPLLSGTPTGKLFDTCEWSAARNVTYYGTLALLLVVTGRRAFGAVMDAMGMQIKGDLF